MAPSVGLRLRALATLLVFLASLGLPALTVGHYALDDDAACGSIQLTVNQSGAQLNAKRPELPPTHCAVCHWLRAVGGSKITGVTVVFAWLEPAAAPRPVTRPWCPAPEVSARPSRAPPALVG